MIAVVVVMLKVFMRDSQKFALQSKLQDEVLSRIILIQQWTRAKLVRCRYLQILKSVMTIQVKYNMSNTPY